MKKKQFNGDKKVEMKSPLARLERSFIDGHVPHFPKWIEGYHLTMATLLWSAGAVFAGYMAQFNLHWLWLSCGMLFMQWFTDSFDGALGRFRDTGIPKWGYYMDHFLDYIFICSILIGYTFLLEPGEKEWVYLLIPVFGGFMINSFLSFGSTNEFKITYLGAGPTEIRLVLGLLNCVIIGLGADWIAAGLPYVLGLAVALLSFVVYRTQKHIWQVDMTEKQNRILAAAKGE